MSCLLHVAVETVGHYFEQSLRAYRNSVGPLDPAFLAAQDDFCRYLLINGQEEVRNGFPTYHPFHSNSTTP